MRPGASNTSKLRASEVAFDALECSDDTMLSRRVEELWLRTLGNDHDAG
jgi:hypothetical protein